MNITEKEGYERLANEYRRFNNCGCSLIFIIPVLLVVAVLFIG